MYYLHMRTRLSTTEATALGVRLRSRLKALGLSQLSLEAETGVDQTQISRIFDGDFTFATPNVDKLCEKLGATYAKNETVRPEGAPVGPSGSQRDRAPAPGREAVIQAFESVWDGSPRHAAAIGELIRAAGPLVTGIR